MNLDEPHGETSQTASHTEILTPPQIRKPADSVMANLPPQTEGKTRGAIAELFGASGRTVDKVKTIQANATPEVQTLARAGEISIHAASQIAALPFRRILPDGMQGFFFGWRCHRDDPMNFMNLFSELYPWSRIVHRVSKI